MINRGSSQKKSRKKQKLKEWDEKSKLGNKIYGGSLYEF